MLWIQSGIEKALKSEVIGRCDGDENPRMTTKNRQKSNAKKKVDSSNHYSTLNNQLTTVYFMLIRCVMCAFVFVCYCIVFSDLPFQQIIFKTISTYLTFRSYDNSIKYSRQCVPLPIDLSSRLLRQYTSNLCQKNVLFVWKLFSFSHIYVFFHPFTGFCERSVQFICNSYGLPNRIVLHSVSLQKEVKLHYLPSFV